VPAGHRFEPQHGEALGSKDQSEYRVITFDPTSWFEAITRSSGWINSNGQKTYVLSGPRGPSEKILATWPRSASVEVRYSPVRLPDIVIIGRIAAYLLSERQGRTHAPTATVIHEPTAVAALTAIFDGMWAAAAVPGDTSPTGSFDPPSPAVLDVLHALASGLTHEAAARKLDQSVRTFRRRISEAYAQLGAVGAFQAGHEATRRGWL
jgi:hypothetical protein